MNIPEILSDLALRADDAFDAVYALQQLHFEPFPEEVAINPSCIEDTYRAGRIITRFTLTALGDLCTALHEAMRDIPEDTEV